MILTKEKETRVKLTFKQAHVLEKQNSEERDRSTKGLLTG